MSGQRWDTESSNVSPGLGHPYDVDHREYIRALLTDARTFRGMSATGLALAAGQPKSLITDFENRENSSHWWRMASLQRWAMVLNMQFTVGFGDIGLEANRIYQKMATSDQYWADLIQGRLRQPMNEGWVAMEILANIRKERGYEEAEMADKLGIKRGTLQNMERTKSPRLSTIQRYTRGLGGMVRLTPSLWTPKMDASRLQ